jgi:hypothetical protein
MPFIKRHIDHDGQIYRVGKKWTRRVGTFKQHDVCGFSFLWMGFHPVGTVRMQTRLEIKRVPSGRFACEKRLDGAIPDTLPIKHVVQSVRSCQVIPLVIRYIGGEEIINLN